VKKETNGTKRTASGDTKNGCSAMVEESEEEEKEEVEGR